MSTQQVTQEIQEQMPTVIEVPAAKKPRNPFDSALVMTVGWKWPKLSKSVSSEQLTIIGETPLTDKRKVHSSKDLFDCPELKRMFGHAGQVDDFLYRRCLPFPLQRGTYLLPKDFFHEVENFLTEHRAEREPLIEAILAVYDKAIEDAKIFLGPLFHANDYLPKDRLRTRFSFEWKYLQIGVSDALKEISAEIAAREADKMQATYTEASEAIQSMLRTSMNDLIAHLCERLEPTPEGKKKIFRDSSMDNIQEFLRTFSSRNLTEDNALENLVAQAQQLVAGVSPANLRDNEGLRDSVQKGFSEIKEKLSALIQDAPIRQLRLAD